MQTRRGQIVKAADRSLKLLNENIPALPMEPVSITAPIVSPPLQHKPLPDPVPILHQYKTRSVTRAQAHLPPRVNIPLPRVQHIQCDSPPRVKKNFSNSDNLTKKVSESNQFDYKSLKVKPKFFQNFAHNITTPIISPLRLGNYNYKVHTGRLPSLQNLSAPKNIVPEVDIRTPEKIV